MKQPPPQPSSQTLRTDSDNLCKRLAELFPDQFAEWVFGVGGKVKVEKTELDREPVRADSVIFSHTQARSEETLHAEFQTTMKSRVPVPLRMLDYYVGLKRQKPKRRREATGWSRVLAGLRYDKGLINRLLKESDMLEESVIYQDIFQKGEQRGKQLGELRGELRGELKMASLLIETRFGKLSRGLRKQMEQLPMEQVEELGKALLAFTSKDELRDWLKQHAVESTSAN